VTFNAAYPGVCSTNIKRHMGVDKSISGKKKYDHVTFNAAYPGVCSTNIKRHMGVDKSISGKKKIWSRDF
jgi:hypothetical protein